MIPSSTTSTMTVRPRDAGNPDALYQVRLLSALRSGDPAQIHPFLSEIGRDKRQSTSSEVDLGAAALHLAVRCASCETVALLLSQRSISPNAIHPPGSGTTALHLAASLPRPDVVNLLLEQDGIDDTLRDARGRTCIDVAKGKEAQRAIKDSRILLNASYRSLLRTYILSPHSERPPELLIQLLSSPRIRLVDLSYLDDATGTTLLHEAARRKDLRMVELAVRAGADVFMRDRKGKMAYDGLGKDDRVRVFLRQFTNQDTTLIEPATSTEPPELKGYLNKYVNVAKGYSVRWFVLRNGILSYYHHQEDEQVASRGSIAMKTAILKTTPGSGGQRFEVHSMPTRGSHATQKWYIRANHPVEASRWIQALTKSIEWARREAERQSVDSVAAASEVSSLRTAVSVPAPGRGPSTSVSYVRRSRQGLGTTSAQSSIGGDDAGDMGDDSPPRVREASGVSGDEGDPYAKSGETERSSSVAESEHVPPHTHNNAFDLHANATIAQMELTADLLTNLPAMEIKSALVDAFQTASGLVTEYVQMARERDEWWKERVERERERQNVWEESLQAVVREGEIMEKELRNKARRRSKTMTLDSSGYLTASQSEMGTVRTRPSALALEEAPEVTESPEPTAVPANGEVAPTTPPTATPAATALTADSSAIVAPAPVPASSATEVPAPLLITPPSSASAPRQAVARRVSSITSPAPRPFSILMSAASPKGDEDDVDTDEEDEFFDAIESNNLPNLVIKDSLTGHSHFELPAIIDQTQYSGYAELRRRLAISSDDRPPMSLWAVLKNSIGKDLTKISFPVFFNEPTSMLQRMAEDMEFSECLDAAASEEDPHKRIAFVAAFAMSNYSSTIGRIAKPFNPMLSETFEYVRLDKKYRYYSEQVSHHPPISACWAESPAWRYYGEVDAQNKFMGKSFEIRPTGVAHADLLLPEALGPSYPKETEGIFKGKVVEHYSWKKVTTNISGFILGSPTIDHYGDMIITNHRTGDQCVLTFKPRGWRGRDAFEIAGYVADKEGNVTYEIAGRWNSQLVARAVGTGVGHLHPDVAVTQESSSSEFFLLWRNSVKPPAPFNLTPFAITLNDCPEDTLKPYICPTDCRLRPDQRAFELGRYERANMLKNKQEEFQRATRKAREEGRVPSHRPRWFTAETEPDTGERVWAPSRVDNKVEYWTEREKVWREKHDGHGARWKAVDKIFIDDEP